MGPRGPSSRAGEKRRPNEDVDKDGLHEEGKSAKKILGPFHRLKSFMGGNYPAVGLRVILGNP